MARRWRKPYDPGYHVDLVLSPLAFYKLRTKAITDGRASINGFILLCVYHYLKSKGLAPTKPTIRKTRAGLSVDSELHYRKRTVRFPDAWKGLLLSLTYYENLTLQAIVRIAVMTVLERIPDDKLGLGALELPSAEPEP
jgi:hypothetical protein